jgi:protocatechuate 3,4-dioxygenase beta subunit
MKPLFYFLCLLSIAACAQPADKRVGDGCEDCDLMFKGMPKEIASVTRLVPASEPGEPMIISGTMYKADGRTPAPGVILYVYHTDNKGLYPKGPGEGNDTRHGRLRGWVKSDANGKYQFTTIRPASYPQGRNPQHIHPLVKEPGYSLYWIDEYLFEDDPFLTTEERARQPKRGGNGIIKLTKDAKGVWIGKRDITLGQNVPGY